MIDQAIDVRDVTKTYTGRRASVTALDHLSLSIPAGEFVAIQGPSGCGKTTLLLAVGGLLGPTSGRVSVMGQDVYALTSSDRARLRAAKIGFVFQQFHLAPYLNVLDNILAPSLAYPAKDARERATALMARFGLGGREQHYPAELSTGERQRTALARALLNQPSVLLADEPTGNLDADNADVVFATLTEFAANGGAVLLVTHDVRAASHAHRIVEMADGRISVRHLPSVSGAGNRLGH